MSSTRTFPLASILTITTGRLLSPRGIEAVYEILNWLTNDYLLTHQLPRAAAWAGPQLLAQFPSLAGVEPPQDADEAALLQWLADAEDTHGATLTVTRPDGWEHQDAVEELCDMVGPERVYVATPETESGRG